MADASAIILRMPSKYAPKMASPPAEKPAPAEEVLADDAGVDEDPATAPGPSPSEPASSAPACSPPSLEWLLRTWTVTHSTLSMWRSARNVRITYKALPAKPNGRARIDDLVEYEPSNKTGVLKTVAGVDTQAAAAAGGAWNWRGKGLLFLVGSHWEILAWGEETAEDGETERWAVVWFAATLFTKEGLDVYCDRREGLSAATYRRIEDALRSAGGVEVAALAEGIMPVQIQLPWIER